MKDDLTIKEIKTAKAELEDNIASLLSNFYHKYDILVEDIVIDITKLRDYSTGVVITDYQVKANLIFEI